MTEVFISILYAALCAIPVGFLIHTGSYAFAGGLAFYIVTLSLLRIELKV